jgi:hypothetical protein
MNAAQRISIYFLVSMLGYFAVPLRSLAQTSSNAAASQSTLRDGRHDFDWQLGSWKIHMQRLQHPFTGSTKWTELDGTVVVRKVWQGRANLAEIVTNGASGHLEFLSLRLYNPQAHQWSLNFASSNSGTLGVPMIGEFKNGRGEFYDQETFNGRMILVRFVFTADSPDSTRDEQSFSEDGGKTWEVNWINTATRIKDQSGETSCKSILSLKSKFVSTGTKPFGPKLALGRR